ncbi:MAG TPA: nitroreductase family protein [Thermomicrobiales bacterium]|nr:nitroreductase family protein [Thermomicrobiales bacterium]
MVEITSNADALEAVRTVRQVRQYEEGTVSPDDLNQVLEIARWTGSSRNTQPWHFVVVDDKGMLKQLSDLRENITWVADGALAIAILLPNENPPHEAYDAGRVTERIMIAARFLGLGSGTAWFGEPEREAKAKQLLGVPEHMSCHSVVVIGPYVTSRDPRPTGPKPGRKSLDELVSYGTYGETR